jgi:hypothetical protein
MSKSECQTKGFKVEEWKVQGGKFKVQTVSIRGYFLIPTSYFLANPSTLPPFTLYPHRRCHQFDNTLSDAGAGRFVTSAQHFAPGPREKPEEFQKSAANLRNWFETEVNHG